MKKEVVTMFDLMPFRRNDNNLFNYLDNMERNFFGDSSANLSQFRTDILDRGDHYEMQAELPGFKKEDIKIDLEDNILTITAEHKEEMEEKKDNYVRRERKFGSFSRSFDVTDIDVDKITASYENGILKLAMPKMAPVTPPTRQITVE